MYDDITIILQGLVNPHVDLNNTILEYKKYGKIVLSVYRHQLEDIIKTVKIWDNICIVVNDIDIYDVDILKYPLKSTHYYQLQTTKKALDVVSTKYVIKTRIDHYYSNLYKLIERHIQTKKITCISHYVRGFFQYKYHLSDCLFMGPTKEIKSVIDLSISKYPFPDQHLYPNEVQLWKPYIFSKIQDDETLVNNIDNNFGMYINILSDLFEIININEFKPYFFKQGSQVITEFSDINNDKIHLLSYGV